MRENFTWIETYQEVASKLRTFREKQGELLVILSELRDLNIPTIALTDKDLNNKECSLSEIDPFTFFANFNRGIKTGSRIQIIEFLINRWKLSCSVPSDFSGIPLVSNRQSRFILYKKERGENDVALLWDLFEQALDNQIEETTFNTVLGLKLIGYNITMGLFWISPERYLNLDNVNRDYLEKKGIPIRDLPNYSTYMAYMDQTKELLKEPFYKISHEAWLQHKESDTETHKQTIEESEVRYWLFAPGKGGEYWNEFYSNGTMAIGWDYLGDLRQYSSKKEVARALREHDKESGSSKKNNANGCFSFCKEMKQGDIVFAKIGRNRILGRGTVTSDYYFDNDRDHFKHVRKVKWDRKGEWTVSKDKHFALKTITEVTGFKDFVGYLNALVGTPDSEDDSVASPGTPSYWWLNANPKIWDIVSPPIGTRQRYTSHNSKGNKRRVYQYFKEVKPGDILLGYAASPLKQIVALCKVTKGLYDSPEGEGFEFEKVEDFPESVPFKQLHSLPELKNCEPLNNNQGSLFRLTPNEYEAIRGIIDEKNEEIKLPTQKALLYTIEQCAESTGFPPSKIEAWKSAIKRKGQIVFYGPPGTGKTFLANHLARHLVGGSDGFIELIQFHPAYAYEEFMQGIRPDTDAKGNLLFELTPGRFLSFCQKARVCEGPCVLIIDEINRANLSRVLGELMYLLEYRNRGIPLAGGLSFSIPTNVYIIGTMNTADRSIALVDFALRRRFAFIELSPEYNILRKFHQDRGVNVQPLLDKLREINTRINDKNFFLGISFFMVENLMEVIEQIWIMEIEPYLEEYFFSQPDSVNSFRWNNIKDKIIE